MSGIEVLLHPRGTTEINDQYTGPASQITIDIERNEARLHDGVTPGGHRILNLTQLMLIFMSKDSEFGNVAFAEGDLGFLVRIGDREWTLREFIEGDGISITNPLGTEDNPEIAIDADFLGKLLLKTAAGRIIHAGLTDGDGDHFTLPEIEDWDPDLKGSVFLCTFHTAANANADLTINGVTRDLKTPNGSQRVNEVIYEDTVALILTDKDAAAHYLIGLQSPQEIGIQAIDGLAATNVQDALEELAGRVVGSGGGLGGYQKYGNLTSIPGAQVLVGGGIKLHERLPLNGDSLIAVGNYFASGGTGGADNPVTHFSTGDYGWYITKLDDQYFAGIMPMQVKTLTAPNPLNGISGSISEAFIYDPEALYAPPPSLLPIAKIPKATVTTTSGVVLNLGTINTRVSETRPVPAP